MKTIKLLTVLFLSAFLLFSCVEEIDITEESTTIFPNPGGKIRTQLSTTILDEDRNPIAGVTVEIKTTSGWQSLVSDEYGNVLFRDVEIQGKSAYVRASHNGMFPGLRRVSVIANTTNFTTIEMLEKVEVGRFSNANGATISNDEGMQIRFPANAISEENGNAYSGEVRVLMNYIDPTDEDLIDRMVGDLSGYDTEGNAVALGTYGMVHVELRGENGQELQVASGKEVELAFPLQEEQAANAPQEIPLWTYDEDLGTWLEEGSARIEGNKLKGMVSHFSAWNVDWKGETIEIKGCVTIEGNSSSRLTAYRVFVESDLFGTIGGYLSADGRFRFYQFPKDIEFTLAIKDVCGNEVFRENYGPYSSSTDIGCIDLPLSNGSKVVKGFALDCYLNPLENMELVLFYLNRRERLNTDANGQFKFVVPECLLSTGSLVIRDYSSGFESERVSLSSTSGMDTLDLGSIELCSSFEGFFAINVDNYQVVRTSRDWLFGVGSGGFDVFYYRFFYQSIKDTTLTNVLGEEISLWVEETQELVGTHEGIGYFDFRDSTDVLREYEADQQSINGTNLQITITSIDRSHTEGFFEGVVRDEADATLHPIDGRFRMPSGF